MDKIFLFDLASRHADWASVRQATIAANIANANTPAYRAADVEPFAKVLDQTHLTPMRTSAGHLAIGASEAASAKVRDADSWEVSESGNTVSLDQEMVKAAETSGAFTLNTSVVRAFHRMVLSSVRNA
ncbi:flagellar basal body rod protein FlgB [Ancylobacter vacuolatus]|uniref:Flagellar basal body rod protein FlgB n=1 Tax=Ancylobacter vacuolatus TaxID=223389 RepID=A0ABU0DL30_9HYPH|nr:flagellar basal body rod protein FlgB [Ancylobacter vacuolatus]MDQ0348940.1 flagellar basal-body rod protein FlgB [Ancylobacter vacuolatus]